MLKTKDKRQGGAKCRACLDDADSRLFEIYEGLERMNAYLSLAAPLASSHPLKDRDAGQLGTHVLFAHSVCADVLDALHGARSALDDARWALPGEAEASGRNTKGAR